MTSGAISGQPRGRPNGPHGERARLRESFRNWTLRYLCNAATDGKKFAKSSPGFIPGGTHEQAAFFNELQLKTTSPECATRYFDVVGDFDITDLLPRVKAQRLVMHVDQIVPFGAGRQLSAGIAGTRFIALPGRNHLFLEHESASAASSKRSAFS
jgi:hypothetical protein